MRLVFMGSPEFAIPSLTKFYQSDHKITGVVTQPDRCSGRGQRMAPTSVKIKSLELGLPVLQPESFKEPYFIKQLANWKGDCFVVVGFRILPQEIYEMPPKGTVNLHASLLPKYRGAAPIQWALIRGEKKTGLTTFFIEKKVDAGDLILQKTVTIKENETAGELHDRLADVGADLLLRSIKLIDSGHVKRFSQKGKITLAPKILPQHCLIDWNHPAERIIDLIRGLSPKPGAFTFYRGKRIKIFKAISVQNYPQKYPPGLIVSSRKQLIVQAGENQILVQELQMEGKRKMDVSEFLKGSLFKQGNLLG